MPPSFRKSMNLGFRTLLAVVFTVNVFSYLLKYQTLEEINKIVMVDEIKLSAYSEVEEFIIDAGQHLSLHRVSERMDDETGAFLGIDEALKRLEKIKKFASTSYETRMIKEIAYGIQYIKGLLTNYKRMTNDDYADIVSLRELEQNVWDASQDLMNLTRAAVQGVRNHIENEHNRILRLNIVSQMIFMIILSLACIAVFIIVFIMNRAIAYPMNRLMKGVDEISKGNFDYRVVIASKDEFGQLAQAFNNMCRDFKKTISRLGQVNQELKVSQTKLIQSAKMSAVGQLAGGVAHEINNPLTGILNNTQLIKLQLKEEKDFRLSDLKEILDMIEDSALRCRRIVANLLEYASAGRRPHQLIGINEVIEKTLILAEAELKLRNIKIIKELEDNLPMVIADSGRLQQVFLDIISNAKWAMKDKKDGELRIKTHLSFSGQLIVAAFLDTGCGISAENLPHIFEPFFTTKPVNEGTGLGLSIAFRIIKEYKGTIYVKSQGIDKGAAFRILLPIAGPRIQS